jgi:N6-adenosine-specific RNA methylase IME4
MQLPVSILYPDPPWWYGSRKTGGERKKKLNIEVEDRDPKFGGGARKHYQLMRDEDLLILSPLVRGIMAEDSICFMWATRPRKDFAIELLKAWGFRFVTEPFTWLKLKKDKAGFIYGPGHYTASNAEDIILGVRGSMEPWHQMTRSVIMTPRFEHSRKPTLHRLIDRMYPQGRRIEMFARQARNRKFASHRWEAIGNGITGKDIHQELRELSLQINGGLQMGLWAS